MGYSEKNGEINPAFVVDDEKNVKGLSVNGDVGPPVSDVDPPPREYGPRENWRMLKNVFLISFSFAFLFTAFQSMAALQSSINAALGTYSLSVLYGSLVISSMFLPTFLIRKFTAKWTLVFAVLGYSIYIAAQFEPRYETLIPAAVIVGFAGAPLWSSKCTILTHIGHEYSRITGQPDSEVIIVRFFGIFFLFFQSASIWGNLISSAVLSQDKRPCQNDVESICGVNYCPDSQFCDKALNDSSSGKISDTTKYTLSGIYLGCSLTAAVLLAIFLDPLTRYGEKDRAGSSSKLSGKNLFIATFKHMKKPYQILMIPLTIWSGLEQGFFGAEYTNGFVNCAWGIEKIGYVLICYGIVDAIGSLSFGPIIKFTGRLPIFIFGALINIAMIIVMLTWTPNPDKPIMFFVVAACWGLGDAIWQTQINAFYGVLFPQDEEPSFSNYRLWESLGFIFAYVFSNVICVRAKLYILLAELLVGMTGYLAIEFMERKNKAN